MGAANKSVDEDGGEEDLVDSPAYLHQISHLLLQQWGSDPFLPLHLFCLPVNFIMRQTQGGNPSPFVPEATVPQ